MSFLGLRKTLKKKNQNSKYYYLKETYTESLFRMTSSSLTNLIAVIIFFFNIPFWGYTASFNILDCGSVCFKNVSDNLKLI